MGIFNRIRTNWAFGICFTLLHALVLRQPKTRHKPHRYSLIAREPRPDGRTIGLKFLCGALTSDYFNSVISIFQHVLLHAPAADSNDTFGGKGRSYQPIIAISGRLKYPVYGRVRHTQHVWPTPPHVSWRKCVWNRDNR